MWELIKEASRGIRNWNIGIINEPIENFIDGENELKIQWFPPKSEGFLADPFPIELNGDTYIFFEHLEYSSNKGKISFIRYSGDIEENQVHTAHEEPFHMSYPYPVKYEGDTYIIPETYEANEVRLYQVNSPSSWEFKTAILTETKGIDPTMVEFDDYFWLFYTKYEDNNRTLYIQYSEDLFGPWRPHEINPVKTDIASSRPGGTPFVDDGLLYRPAQNCRTEYGEAIVINRITELSPTKFNEEKINEIRPPANSDFPCGRHTLASNGDVTLIDGKRYVRNKYFLKKRVNKATSIMTDYFLSRNRT